MKTQSAQKDLSWQFAECFSYKDLKGLSALFHSDVSLYDPSLKWVKGKEKVIEVLKIGFETFQHVSYKVIEMFEDRETTILRFEIVMDDKKFVGVDFLKWQDQKLIDLIYYYNPPEN